MEEVILVDAFDCAIGTSEKLLAHREGRLHRAVSVFIFNPEGQMLLQQRALSKYHSGGLWSNACCGHPRPGESEKNAAERRLFEEMGVRCQLEKVWEFTYKVVLDYQLTEHEFDHVFVGRSSAVPNPHPEEVCAWKWAHVEAVEQDVTIHPHLYTAWFKLILNQGAYLNFPDQPSFVRSVEK